jgi:hypothetical protein
MNPNPANNQITDNNNQPINPVPTPPSNQEQTSAPQVPQLENETPMDITIYPSNENPNINIEPEKLNEVEIKTEPQAVTSISSNNELPPLPPLPSINLQSVEPQTPVAPTPVETISTVNEPIPNLTQPVSLNTNPVATQENKINNQNTQKIAIIGGILLGILVVASISIYYLTSLTSKETITNNTATPTPITTPTQAVAPSPVRQNVTSSEYKLKIDSISQKYANVITKNPINLTSNVLSTETVKFVGDEIFALATEVNELNVSPELSPVNSKLTQELNAQVQIYDNLLKDYKTSNTLSMNAKNKFTAESKASTDRLNLILLEIKNLK